METEGKSCLVTGRIVWTAGDLFKGRQKIDMNTKQPRIGKDGQPMMEYGFGLAVPKSVVNQQAAGQPGEIFAVMFEQAYQIYPNRQLPPAFAFKFKDGDGIDPEGKSFALRPGYKDHYVLSLTSGLPIQYFIQENGMNIVVNEGIKCGDYVMVQVRVKAHGAQGQGKPGLYLNPQMALRVGFGEAIINAPSADQVFGTAPIAVPAGASAMPIGPQNFGQAMPPAAPQGFPGMPPQAAAPMGQPAMPQPHYGVLPAAHQPQVPMGQPAMPAPAQMPMAQAPMPQQAAPQGFPGMPQMQQPAMPGVPQGFPFPQ